MSGDPHALCPLPIDAGGDEEAAKTDRSVAGWKEIPGGIHGLVVDAEAVPVLYFETGSDAGDAMFCQRDLCQEIIDNQGHYFFVVKDNQPSLREALAAEFTAAFSPLH